MPWPLVPSDAVVHWHPFLLIGRGGGAVVFERGQAPTKHLTGSNPMLSIASLLSPSFPFQLKIGKPDDRARVHTLTVQF